MLAKGNLCSAHSEASQKLYDEKEYNIPFNTNYKNEVKLCGVDQSAISIYHIL